VRQAAAAAALAAGGVGVKPYHIPAEVMATSMSSTATSTATSSSSFGSPQARPAVPAVSAGPLYAVDALTAPTAVGAASATWGRDLTSGAGLYHPAVRSLATVMPPCLARAVGLHLAPQPVSAYGALAHMEHESQMLAGAGPEASAGARGGASSSHAPFSS